MPKYILCPICEINYMLEGEDMCDVCKRSTKTQIHSESKHSNSNTKFVFKNEYLDNEKGFTVYDILNGVERLVGIVIMITDKRVEVSYKKCQIHFFNKFYEEYGEWHIFTVNGKKIEFFELETKLKKEKFFTLEIDPW